MRESGLLKNWINKWTPKNLHCKGLGPVTQSKQATVKDFQGAFYLLMIGIASGLLLLVLEYIYYRRLRNSKLKGLPSVSTALCPVLMRCTATVPLSVSQKDGNVEKPRRPNSVPSTRERNGSLATIEKHISLIEMYPIRRSSLKSHKKSGYAQT